MDMEYLAAGPVGRARIRLLSGIRAFPRRVMGALCAIPRGIAAVGRGIGRFLLEMGLIFVRGDVSTKLSFFIMGLGCIRRGRIWRGLLYAGLQAAFWLFFLTAGMGQIAALSTLGTRVPEEVWNEERGIFEYTRGDNSMLVLLYGVVSLLIAVLYLVLYFGSIDGLRVQSVALLSYIDPVSALLFSALLLREPLSAAGIIGAVMIIGSAVVSETGRP